MTEREKCKSLDTIRWKDKESNEGTETEKQMYDNYD